MSCRTITAVIGGVALVAAIVFAISGAAGTAATARVDGMYRGYARSYAEPAGVRLADGTYLGFVRTDGRDDESVAVDFVSLRDGAVGNARPEVLVDAGAIAHAHFFASMWQPFRITIQSQTIVSALSADDVLPARTTRPNTTPRGEIP